MLAPPSFTATLGTAIRHPCGALPASSTARMDMPAFRGCKTLSDVSLLWELVKTVSTTVWREAILAKFFLDAKITQILHMGGVK